MIDRKSVGGASESRPWGRSVRVALLLAGAVTGCASVDTVESPGGRLGSARYALGEDSCGTAIATGVIDDQSDFRSPDVYTTEGCSDAVVIDVPSVAFNGTITLRDVGVDKTNATECDNLRLIADFYCVIEEPDEPTRVLNVGSTTARAQFFAPQTCLLPVVDDFDTNPRALGLNAEEAPFMTTVRVAVKAGQNVDHGFELRPVEVSYSAP
jgi:hypothetical protein